MNKFVLLIIVFTVCCFSNRAKAQEQKIFSWNMHSAVINASFIEHPERLYKIESEREYSVRSYKESIGQNKYVIEIKSPYNFEVDNSYEAIFIKNAATGEILLRRECIIG